MSRARIRRVIAIACLSGAAWAGRADAVTVHFTGTLTLAIATLPPLVSAGSGSATLNGSGGLGPLSSVTLPAGAFVAMQTIPVTDPAASPIHGIQESLVNGAGSFQLGGKMALAGNVNICLFAACSAPPPANLVLPFTSNGTRGVGLGGGPVRNTGAVNLTLDGAPWTVGTATVSAITRMGFVHGPASGGASSAAAESGVLQLVTPTSMRTNVGIGFVTPLLATLELHFAPEPGTMAMVALGVAMLAGLGRQRLR